MTRLTANGKSIGRKCCRGSVLECRCNPFVCQSIQGECWNCRSSRKSCAGWSRHQAVCCQPATIAASRASRGFRIDRGVSLPHQRRETSMWMKAAFWFLRTAARADIRAWLRLEICRLPPKLLRKGITDMVRLSDARMSGTAYGTVVLHASPEAALGGTLALVQSGDHDHSRCSTTLDSTRSR